MVPAAGSPQATQVNGVPASLWGTQRDYDQAIAVDPVGGTADRVYLGGSTIYLDGDWSASLWCFDVAAGAPRLDPAVGISRVAAPPAEEGASTAGAIGNDVHADVHSILLGGLGNTGRQVWVGCDGGIFVSANGGRVHTFASASVGLASLQAGFVAAIPSSSQFVAAGFQDNGTQVRAGDTVWEEIFEGDGGGLAFHPWQSQYIVGQWTTSVWNSAPDAGFVQPTSRLTSGDQLVGDLEADQSFVSFYSGCAIAAAPPAHGPAGDRHQPRLAQRRPGLVRAEHLAGAALPDRRTDGPPARRRRPRPSPRRPERRDAGRVRERDHPGRAALDGDHRALGVSDGADRPLRRGVVRWTENPPGQWTTDIPISRPAGTAPFGTLLTDLFPIPGTGDFYLTTTGDPTTPPPTPATCGTARRRRCVPRVCGTRSTPQRPRCPRAARAGVRRRGRPGCADRGISARPPRDGRGVHGTGPPAAGPVADRGWTAVRQRPAAGAVQDLSIWHDPADPPAPRLLRAAVQSRGVWEVDLAAAAASRRAPTCGCTRTTTAAGSRRRWPTRAGPRPPPAEPAYASPDIVVRPKAGSGDAPPGSSARATIRRGNVPAYQLWTFQTAFRWIYPSVQRDGAVDRAFGDLRARRPAAAPPVRPAGSSTRRCGISWSASASTAPARSRRTRPTRSPSTGRRGTRARLARRHRGRPHRDRRSPADSAGCGRCSPSPARSTCCCTTATRVRCPAGRVRVLLWRRIPTRRAPSTRRDHGRGLCVDRRRGLPAPPAGWTLAAPGGGAPVTRSPSPSTPGCRARSRSTWT